VSGSVERAELKATLPGTLGLECTLYEYIAYRTVKLCEQVYITFVVEDGEFRPAAFWEHAPRSELQRYQLATAFQGREMAYGHGRTLEVSFVCYSPKGSVAAGEAVREIGGVLEKLREVAEWPERKRSWFGLRHGVGQAQEAIKGASGFPYRPPEDALPYREGPPVAGKPDTGSTIQEVVRGHLKRWGMAEDWDRMRAEGERKKAEKRRERLLQEEIERQADPFAGGTACPTYPTNTVGGPSGRGRTRRGRQPEPERGQWEWESPWERPWS